MIELIMMMMMMMIFSGRALHTELSLLFDDESFEGVRARVFDAVRGWLGLSSDSEKVKK
jgi:hypothetical protein